MSKSGLRCWIEQNQIKSWCGAFVAFGAVLGMVGGGAYTAWTAANERWDQRDLVAQSHAQQQQILELQRANLWARKGTLEDQLWRLEGVARQQHRPLFDWEQERANQIRRELRQVDEALQRLR